jgi:uncharacterized protein
LPSSSDPSAPSGQRRFLSPQWRYLAMLNYAIDPSSLSAYLPAGTEIDYHDGKTYVSLVGFRFLDTRVMRVRIPAHRDFDEVNLRFYVRRTIGSEIRRGVVFVREIVPKFLIAAVARLVYNEQYIALPMKHDIAVALDRAPSVSADYRWYFGGRWQRLFAQATGRLSEAPPGSLSQFITEHYWGYAKQRGGGTREYKVWHPPWRLWPEASGRFEGDAAGLYGTRFAEALARIPDSVCVAEGSDVHVFAGRTIA